MANAKDEWDLVEVISERAQPEESVEIFLNEMASYAKAQLLEARDRSKDAKAIALINKQLDGVEKEIESKKYVVHITAIPSRMREDIASRAMHEVPVTADWTGRDNAENQMKRTILENDMLWNAQITRVVNPAKAVKSTWTLEETQTFKNSIPIAARNSITEAIGNLNNKAEQYTAKGKSIDF